MNLPSLLLLIVEDVGLSSVLIGSFKFAVSSLLPVIEGIKGSSISSEVLPFISVADEVDAFFACWTAGRFACEVSEGRLNLFINL